jgi:hypothetical protein
VTEVGLESPRVVPFVGQSKAAGMTEHVGWALKHSSATSPARSIMRAKPAVVKGEPRAGFAQLTLGGSSGVVVQAHEVALG